MAGNASLCSIVQVFWFRLAGGIIESKGGENVGMMELGMIIGGLGLLLGGIGIIWGVSIWSKQKEKK